MTTSSDEITMALDELETRLDRLRSLYEQYFTGIERAPPAVQHKDVERRVQLLRKMNIRSTSQRFRFQTLVQKYTTYLQYWQRILRRIEEGTHRRDLARAARYGAKSQPRRSTDNVYELDPDAIEDVSGDEFDGDVDEAPTTERAALAPPVAASPAKVSPPAQATTPAATGVTRQIEVLPFDVVEAPAKTVAVPEVTRASSVPSVPTVQKKVEAPVAAPAPAPQPAKKPGLSVFGVAQKPAAQKPAGPAPSTPAATPVAKTPAPLVAQTPKVAPTPTVASPSAATPVAQTPAMAARPAMAATAPAPALVTRPTPAVTPSGGASRPTSTDAALRDLYERYRSARQKNGEAEVEFDTVAKQVRDTLPKLREKYPGQNVELDVSVKDGKTVLRPIVKAKK